jgi:hypothetical protein
LKGKGCLVGVGLPVALGMGVKKTVGREVLVGGSSLGVSVGPDVGGGALVHVGTDVAVGGMGVFLGVGVNITAMGTASGLAPRGLLEVAINTAMKITITNIVSANINLAKEFHVWSTALPPNLVCLFLPPHHGQCSRLDNGQV